MRNCLSLIGCGTVLVVGLVVAWFARDELADLYSRFAGREDTTSELVTAAGPELARRVEARVVALGQGETDEVALSAEEFDAWIRYGLEGFLPAYVSEPRATIEDDQVALNGTLIVDQVPGIGRWGPVAGLLGDSAAVRVRGRVDGYRPGLGVYYVDDVTLGVVPLPDPMRDQLVAQMASGREPGLPANALTFEVPRFVTDIGLRDGQIVLRRILEEGR